VDDVRRPLVCPVLVGRDDLLALAERRVGEVAGGKGQLLLLAGEAGIGKTRLLGSIERMAAARGFRTVRAGTYPSDLQVAAAILIDLSRALIREPDLAAHGRDLAARLDEPGSRELDPGRRRRLLVLDVAETLERLAAADGPIVLSLEDLHWSDDITLEVLEALARRVAELPVLVLATYRSDELFPRAPMREWRARLLGARRAEEVRLRRLSVEETATMAAALGSSAFPPPHDVAEAVHARTDGIPLHVEELLALLGGGVPAGPEAVLRADVPDTVEDAIQARLRQRSAPARRIAEVGAVIGRSFDLEMLSAVSGDPLEDLSAPLAELADHFILLPGPVPGRYGFRHALIGDAIYAGVPEPDRRRLHGRTADAAAVRGDLATGAFLALHYERAGRRDEAFRVALEAADAATVLSSHSEARELYACALRTAPPDVEPALRARILEAYGTSLAATDDNEEAATAFESARNAWLAAGDRLAAAAVIGPLVAVRHLLGDPLDRRADRLRMALAEVDSAADLHGGPADRAADTVRARLLAALAAAHMLDRRLDEGIDYATAARERALNADDDRTERNAATTLGACFVFAGRMEEGWRLLEAAVGRSLEAGDEAGVARAYRMLGSCASVLVEYERGETWLRQGIEYAERVERWNDRHYMAAHLAHVLWATGRWAEADAIARRALADGRCAITTLLTALHVLGFLAVGRGQYTDAAVHLQEAYALASGMRELQRIAPALWGLAELALASGDAAGAVRHAREGVAASEAVSDAAYAFPFAVTGVRALLELGDPGEARRWFDRCAVLVRGRAIPGTLPALDHAEGLLALAEGGTRQARTHLASAVAGWEERGRAWDGAWALLDLARAQLRSNQRTDAAATASRALERARQLPDPRLAEAATALVRSVRLGAEPEPWAPLTSREFEIARLVAAGRTNAEIGTELGIARKTVSAHIEHIFARLGVNRRAEIAAWTASRPVLQGSDQATSIDIS
jgi:DNA-binding CsgD family transcriptional regulator